MIPLIAFWSGMERAARRKRMAVLYWFFHTLCGLLATLPLLGFIAPVLGHSRYADELLRSFDLAWVAELVASSDGRLAPVMAASFLAASGVVLLGGVLLAGGAVALLADAAAPYSPGLFWQNAGRNFWRFLRLALYSSVAYALAFALWAGLGKAAGKAWGEGMAAAPLVYAGWLRTGLLILMAGLVSTAMDFAKVRLAAGDSRHSLRTCIGSLRLVVRNPGTLFWLWALFALCWAVLSWLYVKAANALQAAPPALFILLVSLQQAYLLARVFLRFAAWGAAAELDPILRPQPARRPAAQAAPPVAEPGQAGAAGDYAI